MKRIILYLSETQKYKENVNYTLKGKTNKKANRIRKRSESFLGLDAA